MKTLPADSLHRSTMPDLVRLMMLADFALAGLYILDTAIGHPSQALAHLVNLDGERNLPTWYSSSQLLILGLLLGVFATAIKTNQHVLHPWRLFGLPALCLALSLDEAVSIHEWLGKQSDILLPGGTRDNMVFSRTGIWMLLLGPPLIIAVVSLRRAFSPFLQGRARVVRLQLTGFFMYAASALGVEILSNFVHGVAAVVAIVCEELGEMLGVTLLIWATLDLLASHHIHVRVGSYGGSDVPPLLVAQNFRAAGFQPTRQAEARMPTSKAGTASSGTSA